MKIYKIFVRDYPKANIGELQSIEVSIGKIHYVEAENISNALIKVEGVACEVTELVPDTNKIIR